MAVTGMRGGEVVGLDDEDFDPGRGMLLVRHAKLGKRRLLPLHATTVIALLAYRSYVTGSSPPGQPGAAGIQRRNPLFHYKFGQTIARLDRQQACPANQATPPPAT